MRDVLLINPSNPDSSPSYFGPPYGLSLIGAALLRKKISIAALDFDHLPQETMIAEVRRALKRQRPRLIGITVQSCTRGPVYALMEMIKQERCPATIVLGGPSFRISTSFCSGTFPWTTASSATERRPFPN